MNILKHMEAAFIVAALVAVPASYLGGGIGETGARVQADSVMADSVMADSVMAYGEAVASGAKMATVVVSAKRAGAAGQRATLLAAR